MTSSRRESTIVECDGARRVPNAGCGFIDDHTRAAQKRLLLPRRPLHFLPKPALPAPPDLPDLPDLPDPPDL